jgi:dTDP-4-dehydrorhamnose reductase
MNSPKFLILGATGLLGSRILNDIPNSFGTYNKTNLSIQDNLLFFDGENKDDLLTIISLTQPDFVINCIGLANVDQCETQPEKCWNINTKFANSVALICKNRKIKFIHISTDHFYFNLGKMLHEYDNPSYTNYYGYSKLYAEKFVLISNPEAIIVRTNFFHFNLINPKTFIDNLIIKITNGESVSSFKNVLFTPISTTILIESILKLIEVNYSGIIHVSANEPISKYDFHNLVLDNFGLDHKNHFPIEIDEAKLKANRPKNMSLSNKNYVKILGRQMPSINNMIKIEMNHISDRK